MSKIKVTFSDGSVEIFHEDQTFMTIVANREEETNLASLSTNYCLWKHHHDGLTPSFIELLINSVFFFDVEKPNVIYCSSSIVKFENI